MGRSAIAMKPRRLVAHAMPSLSYTEQILGHVFSSDVAREGSLLWIVKRGNAAPAMYRTRPLAAIADAPFMGP